MSLQTVARRYASALADVIIERREERQVQDEVEQWASLIEEHSQLREAFTNPTVAYDKKRQVLEELITRTRVRETTASFLRVLLKNQRLGELKEISNRLGHVLDERSGVVAAVVTTARPLPENLKSNLEESLAVSTGRKVRLSFATDESIIGGLVARIGSTIFDGSVESQLERLAADLTE
ncbi:MAG TPA: ATP synthase F1 subunit delta [Pyrinomonadaceae bacterium]